MMSSKKIRLLVIAAFFLAVDIIVARYLGFEFQTPMGPVKFDFQIVVAALCGYALGPLWGSLTLVSADLLGVMLNGGSLGIFFGFTLSAFLRGFLFGLLLHKKPVKSLRTVIAIALVFLPVDLCLNTLWLSIMLGSPYMPLLISRILPKVLLMAVEMGIALCLPKLFAIVKIKE